MLLATEVNAVYRNMDVARNKLHFAESLFYFFPFFSRFVLRQWVHPKGAPRTKRQISRHLI